MSYTFKMASLLERFKILTSQSTDINELQAYLTRVTGSGKYFKRKRNTVLIPDKSNKKWILLTKRFSSENKTIYMCSNCSHEGALSSVHSNISLCNLSKLYCQHAKI